LAALSSAATDASEGAKPVLLQDELSVIRWMSWRVAEFVPVPVSKASGEWVYALEDIGEFVEVPA
jgi:hypothetical protein